MKVETSIDIAAPPERVWAVLMDPHRLADWVTIHRALDDVSDVPLERGSTLRQKLNLRGVNFHVRWRVTDLEPCKRAVWEGKGPALSHAHTSYQLSPDGNGGTRFDYVNEFKAPGGPLGATASRIVAGDAPEREAKATLRKLKGLLESE
jgi:uncharacterized protein YndB with AHSA1/START domain